jgi:transcriptional regulator with XRE-family HTH domain
MSIGSRIKQARTGNGTNVSDMADRCGMSLIRYSRIEYGDVIPTSKELLAIAEMTGLSLDFFLRDGGVNEMNPILIINKKENNDS